MVGRKREKVGWGEREKEGDRHPIGRNQIREKTGRVSHFQNIDDTRRIFNQKDKPPRCPFHPHLWLLEHFTPSFPVCKEVLTLLQTAFFPKTHVYSVSCFTQICAFPIL